MPVVSDPASGCRSASTAHGPCRPRPESRSRACRASGGGGGAVLGSGTGVGHSTGRGLASDRCSAAILGRKSRGARILPQSALQAFSVTLTPPA